MRVLKWEQVDERVPRLGFERVVDVGVGLFGLWLPSKKPIAGELRGTAITLAVPVLPMPMPVSGLHSGSCFLVFEKPTYF